MLCSGDSAAGHQAIRSSAARRHRGRQRDKGSLETTADEERDASESKRRLARPLGATTSVWASTRRNRKPGKGRRCVDQPGRGGGEATTVADGGGPQGGEAGAKRRRRRRHLPTSLNLPPVSA